MHCGLPASTLKLAVILNSMQVTEYQENSVHG